MTTELATTTYTETELQKFGVTNDALLAMVEEVKDLKVNGVDDKEGLKKVRAARMTLRNKRIEIKKIGEDLRESANKFQKAVIVRQNELIGIIAPTEDQLLKEEERIESEKESIRVENERKEAEKFQARVNELSKFNFVIDFYDVRTMDDEQYNKLLADAQEDFNKEKALQEERDRIAAEEKARAEKAEAEERERLARVAAEQEAERNRLDGIRVENEKREAELKAQQDKIDRERKEFEEAKQRELDNKIRAEEEERRRVRSLADARYKQLATYGHHYADLDNDLGTMPDSFYEILLEKYRSLYESEQQRIAIAKADAERLERERLQKLEAERQEALKPDKEKLLQYARGIEQVPVPTLADDEAIEVLKYAMQKLGLVTNYIQTQVTNL